MPSVDRTAKKLWYWAVNESCYGRGVCVIDAREVSLQLVLIDISDLHFGDLPKLDSWWSTCAMKRHPWNICSEKGHKCFPAEHPFEMQTIIFADFTYLLYESGSITILFKECTSGWALYQKGKLESFKKTTNKTQPTTTTKNTLQYQWN